MFVMKPRRQGELGEASAIEWFTAQGAVVSLPVGHSPDYDLIAEFRSRLMRVEVKTSRSLKGQRWTVTLRTSGGNQSWSRVVKRWEMERCDLLFAVVGDGRRWCIPSESLGARSTLTLGGAAWAEFEVARGNPLEGDAEPAAALDSPAARWGTEAVKRDAL